jgi:hypothetical protein
MLFLLIFGITMMLGIYCQPLKAANRKKSNKLPSNELLEEDKRTELLAIGKYLEMLKMLNLGKKQKLFWYYQF